MNPKRPTRTVAIVTGSRAEFGLLRPVIDAVKRHPRLRLKLIAAGSHFLPPARTIREVESAYTVAARVPMQTPGTTGRHADARASARGLDGFARAFARLKPDWVVVLGDRIEAFAAAGAASIAGIGVCHIHGGDRAEGIADEAMRHAITKLAHLHCAATKQSAKRIIAMGESPSQVHVTGSPAIDGLHAIRPLSDAQAAEFADPDFGLEPQAVVLLHPSGLPPMDERRLATYLLEVMHWVFPQTTLLLRPNHDSGADIINRVLATWPAGCFVVRDHLPRATFVGLLKRLARPRRRDEFSTRNTRGVFIGNSSAGLIECAALGVPVVNVGPRQSGREQGGNVINVQYRPMPRRAPGLADKCLPGLDLAILKAAGMKPARRSPFGTGRAGPRIAALLATTDPAPLLRKRNAY